MKSLVDLSLPHNRQMKNGQLSVVRKGDDWKDYMIGAENARNTSPHFLQKTIMVDNPDDPASTAIAFQKFEQYE